MSATIHHPDVIRIHNPYVAIYTHIIFTDI